LPLSCLSFDSLVVEGRPADLQRHLHCQVSETRWAPVAEVVRDLVAPTDGQEFTAWSLHNPRSCSPPQLD
jgi:hypothetical protein